MTSPALDSPPQLPMTASVACQILGVGRGQLATLGGCALVTVTTTPGEQRRYDAADVLFLARWPMVFARGLNAVALNVAPLRPDDNAVCPRDFGGFQEGAVATGRISPAQEADAWRGFWNCGDGYVVVAASAAGCLVRAAGIDGVDAHRGHLKRFALSLLPGGVEAQLVGHCIPTRGGPPFTPLP